jgi:hypothetical protein
METPREACLEACRACIEACSRLVSESRLDESGEDLERCVELGRECADTCLVMTELVAAESPQAAPFGHFCATLCRLCARECQRHDPDWCLACADACEACAELCGSVARAA